MHCSNLRLVLGLGLVRVSSRVRVRVKVRVSVLVRVSIRTSWVVNFALFRCYRPVICTRPVEVIHSVIVCRSSWYSKQCDFDKLEELLFLVAMRSISDFHLRFCELDSADEEHSIVALCSFTTPSTVYLSNWVIFVGCCCCCCCRYDIAIYCVRPRIVSWDLQIYIILTTTVFWVIYRLPMSKTISRLRTDNGDAVLHFVHSLAEGHRTQ